KLAAESILANPSATKIYLRTLGDASKLQAGEYQFDSPITPLQILKELEKGETQTIRLTIPEGFTRFDIAKRVAERFSTEGPSAEKQLLQLMDDSKSIGDLAPEAKNLEGYMYPSTYNFPRGSTHESVVSALVQQFKKVWKPEWTLRAREINLTPHQIVTIASLIETESGVEAERPIVASVIYNRLRQGIALGIDQTAVYIAKMENRWDGTIHRSDLDSDSPYNTRKYAGLPPGPISSVSESAILAALNPAETDYIYYVRNVQLNDGSHWFYASAAEFERGKAEYQRWLEKEREALRNSQ
ncbi:MAG: endolytic transglycosylase MltG, partial [Pyrinomonadaceae bacterium]